MKYATLLLLLSAGMAAGTLQGDTCVYAPSGASH